MLIVVFGWNVKCLLSKDRDELIYASTDQEAEGVGGSRLSVHICRGMPGVERIDVGIVDKVPWWAVSSLSSES